MQRRDFLKGAGAGLAASAAVALQGCSKKEACRSRRRIAHHTLAAGLQLPQEPGHHLRRGRGAGQPARQDHRRQIPDPRLRRRRTRPRPAGHGRGAARHRGMRPHRQLLLRRQEHGLRLRLRPAVRPHRPPAERLDVLRRRPGTDPRTVQGHQHRQLPRRQHRRADGRLVPQGNQFAGRPARA